MKVIILAAGASRRLGLDQPKSLIKLEETNLIEIQLNQLLKAGISPKDINIVTGYKYKEFEYLNVNQIYNIDYDKSHQVKSIFCCANFIDFSKEDILISYGDVLYESNIVKELLNSNHDITVPYLIDWKNIWRDRLDDYVTDLETFRINDDHFLIEIGDKVTNIDPNGQFMGLACFKRGALKKLENVITGVLNGNLTDLNKIEFTTALNFLIQNRMEVKAFPYNGIFNELDFPKDLKRLKIIIEENPSLLNLEYLINAEIIK